MSDSSPSPAYSSPTPSLPVSVAVASTTDLEAQFNRDVYNALREIGSGLTQMTNGVKKLMVAWAKRKGLE